MGTSILKEHESGMSGAELARRYGFGESTLYAWKAKYGGLEVNEARRLRDLTDENSRLKKLVAEQALDIDMLKAVNAKKW